MKSSRILKTSAMLLGFAWALVSHAEDIDIFAGTSNSGSAELPNVLLVLDNTSNWSRNSQKWPDGTQGQSEVRAMKAALASYVGEINVGLMMYQTSSNANNNDGGYTRIDMQELTQDYYDNFLVPILTRIENNINDPSEQRSSSNTYGDLTWDVYNYLKGDDQSKGGAGTPVASNLSDSGLVSSASGDPDAYSSQWGTFASPLTSDAICADTYMIYFGNNKNGNIASDSSSNTTALKAAYIDAGLTAPDALSGDPGTPLAQPEFTTVETTEEVCTGGGDGTDYPADSVVTSGTCFFKNSADDACEESAGFCPAGADCSCIQSAQASCGNNYNEVLVSWDAYTVGGGEETCETITNSTAEATGEFDTSSGASHNLDDWTKFLFNTGVPFSFTEDLDGDGIAETYDERLKVITYTIDVFNKQQLAALSQLWFSAANVGGGKYFQAKSEAEILAALEITLGDIVAKASSFAAVTLPLSTTNREQVENEVYIGMFRPEQGKDPRWYGNLKRYQLALFNGVAELADVNYSAAINTLTGFPNDCAESFWTEHSSGYWANLGVSPSVESQCSSLNASDPNEVYSDLPDGPFVEKGGVGQQVRKLASGASRTLYTGDPSDLVLLSTLDPSVLGGATVYSFLIGDTQGNGESANPNASAGLDRPSVHGDVVHSRPLSVRYDDDSVVIYYGANDGFFRAVDTSNGTEKWAFLAPEHHGKIKRLYDDEPLIKYEGVLVDPDDATAEPKDYFFDGPTGYHVEYDDANDLASGDVGDLEYAYIYPTMRRGGRMIYGFDVTDPNDPQLMWRQGCDESDTCSTGYGAIGQTWSTPQGVFVPGYPESGDPMPVLIFGGGYDECLDEDQAAYPSQCSSANGKGIYVADAQTGVVIEQFATDAPVLTDISVVDVDKDGLIEFAYAADAKGNLYRVRFADYTQDMAASTSVPAGAIKNRREPDTVEAGKDPWIVEKIAHTPGTSLRFYNSPTASPLPTLGQIAISIGTGDRERPLESNYPFASDVQNRFYAVLDVPYDDYAAELADAMWARSDIDLEDPNDMYQVGTADGAQLRNYKGWYMDLPNKGEQVANPSVVGAGKVFFNSLQPGGAPGSICSSPIGLGRAYAVNLFAPELVSGDEIAGGGIPIPPIIATVEIPPGCTEADCEGWTPDDCTGDNCESETRTGIIGWDGFEFEQLDPVIDPQIQRIFFTEDIERSNP